jgi:hypothetical protein
LLIVSLCTNVTSLLLLFNSYLSAIFNTSIFSSPSTSTLTQKGVVTHGRRGEYLLAVGLEEQIFPGKAGPAASYSKRFIDKAKELTGFTAETAEDAKHQAKAAAIDTQREADKLGLHIKEYERREARRTGWQSSAFDVSA